VANLSLRGEGQRHLQAFHVSTHEMLRRFGNETGQSPLSFLRQAG
jgi:hypothetical protein